MRGNGKKSGGGERTITAEEREQAMPEVRRAVDLAARITRMLADELGTGPASYGLAVVALAVAVGTLLSHLPPAAREQAQRQVTLAMTGAGRLRDWEQPGGKA